MRIKDREWIAFSALLGGFIGLEFFAIKTKKIKPFSYFVHWVQKNRLTKYMLMGLWTGFCSWTIRHFFFEDEMK